MATIKDVARRAKVSMATVSNYINHTKPVSKELSEQIEEAIRELNYSENKIAKNLKTRMSSDVGIVFPNLNDAYYVQIYQGIKSMFPSRNYFLNLGFSNDDPEMEREIITSLFEKRVCGLIVVSCCPDSWEFYHGFLKEYATPLVLIDRDVKSLDANFVTFNNRANMKKLTDFVIAHGNRKISLMAGPASFTCENECIKGFLDSLKEHGIDREECHIINIEMNKESAFRNTIPLVSHRSRPEAIITTSSAVAAGVIEGTALLGYGGDKIPIYTFGEEHWNLNTHSFAKNCIVRPALKLGQTAARLLLAEQKDPLTKESERVILGGCRLNEYMEDPRRVLTENGGGGGKIRVMLMDTSQSHSLAELLRNFELRSGIKAEIDFLPHPGMMDKILREYEENKVEPYDIFMYDIPWLPTLASRHVLRDITGEIKSFDLNSFIEGSLHYFSMFDGRYYGVPFLYAPQLLFYRKDLFRDPALQTAYRRKNNISLRPPVTLKEFNTVADFFTNSSDAVEYGTTIPAAYEECLTPEIYMRLHAFGASVYDSSGKVTLNSERSLKAYLNFMRAVKFANPDYRNATDFSAAKDFIDGKIAMLITYPSFLNYNPDFRSQTGITETTGYQMIPGNAPLLGGWSLGINARSSHVQEALSFMQWTCNDQVAQYSALLGGLSVLHSAYENDELNNLYPWFPLYKSTFEHTCAIVPPRIGKKTIIPMHDVDRIIFRGVNALLADEMNVQDVLTSTHEELEKLFDEYRKGAQYQP